MTHALDVQRGESLTVELQAALLTWKFRRYGTGDPESPGVQEAEDRFFMLWRFEQIVRACGGDDQSAFSAERPLSAKSWPYVQPQ